MKHSRKQQGQGQQGKAPSRKPSMRRSRPGTPETVRNNCLVDEEEASSPGDLGEKVPGGRAVLFADPQPDSLSAFKEQHCKKSLPLAPDERSNSLYAELAAQYSSDSYSLRGGGRRPSVTSIGLGSLDHLQLSPRGPPNDGKEERVTEASAAIIDRARLNGYTQRVIDKGRVEVDGGHRRRFSLGPVTLETLRLSPSQRAPSLTSGALNPAVALGIAPGDRYSHTRPSLYEQPQISPRSGELRSKEDEAAALVSRPGSSLPMLSRRGSNQSSSDSYGGGQLLTSSLKAGSFSQPRSHLHIGRRQSQLELKVERSPLSSSSKLDQILQGWDKHENV